MSMAASKKGPLDSSSLVSSEAMKLVTLCGTDKTDDEVHDIDDDNIRLHTLLTLKPSPATKPKETSTGSDVLLGKHLY